MIELNLETGQLVGGYTLESRLGAGAMGSVWRVHDDGGHEYAMKILRDSLADGNDSENAPEARERVTARERLRREAMALRRVQHPGVCGIVDMELDDALAFIVTELIEGRNLRDDVAVNGRYVGADLERLTRKLIDAVQAVHDAGIVHRDIKPTNVMVSATGPVLVDFGIAMGEGESHVTRTGLVMGTPGFIAPEIIDGAESDELTDWWSVASVLAFAATGTPVFGTKPMMTVLERAAAGRANLSGLPPTTMAAFRAALDPDRSKRCTPQELLHAIEHDALDPTSWEVVRPFQGDSPLMGNTTADNPRRLWADDDAKDTNDERNVVTQTIPSLTRPLMATASPPPPPLEPPEQSSPLQEIRETVAYRETCCKRGLRPCLLAAIPIALLATARPFGALLVAFLLLWAALSVGISADAQYHRQMRRGGERRRTDKLKRIITLPWHITKGFALALLRIVPLSLIALGIIIALTWMLNLPRVTYPPTSSEWTLASLLPADTSFSTTGVVMALTAGCCWLVSALAFSADTIRIGAGILSGMTTTESSLSDETRNPSTVTIALGALTVLALIMMLVTPMTTWFPLVT